MDSEKAPPNGRPVLALRWRRKVQNLVSHMQPTYVCKLRKAHNWLGHRILDNLAAKHGKNWSPVLPLPQRALAVADRGSELA